jgi:hypothetical protein
LWESSPLNVSRECWINLFLPFYTASGSVQQRLVDEFGYPECPSCGWSAKILKDHFKENSYCLKQVEWEEKEDDRIWNEIYEYDEWLRKDNEEPD